MKASLAESFIPRERAARPGGRSPNSGSKPATEPQRAPPGCAGFPNRRFGPFGRLALLAFVLTAMLQPLHLALAQMNCVNCSNNFTFQCGMSVATCFPGAIGIPGGNPSCIEVPAANVNLNGYSLVMMDTRTAPARLWLPPMFHNECPQVDPTNIWNAQNLGTVFGITLDTATPPNIYVAATSIYVANRFVPGVGPGGVFKIDGSTFAVSPFSMIPSVGSVSLGDICYDKVNHQFFVSELDRGLIWRLDGTSGAPTSFYDHGVMGRQNASPSLPTIPDNNMPDELTVPGRRVFGLQIHDGRLFYAVWTNGFNEIWSVGVVFGGVTLVPPNGPKLEIPGTVLTSPTGAENGCAFQTPVSDIAFSSEGDKMLLGERGICVCDLTDLRTEAHESRVREFTFMSGTWTLTTDYRIGPDYTPRGQPFPHRNAAGGVDYDCNGCIYATGDLLKDPQPPYIYGVQVLCPPTCTNDDCSYLIDLNCDTTDTAKTQIGDVEVYRCCEVAEAIGCRVTGGSNHQLNSIHAAAPCPVTTPPTHISHGGQVGAPFSAGTAFTPSSPCISGEWQHNRHLTGSSLVGTFHASGNGNVHQFDSLLCACLPCPEDPGAVGVVNGLCNPDRRICGPEPRRAPANKITFSGVGDYTFGNGVKTVPAVFRVDITDRSEGNSPSSTLPPDRYRFRAWLLDPLCPHAVGPMLLRLQASANPATIGGFATTEDLTPISPFLPVPPDIDDGGDMTQGNHQIHPATGADCGASMLAPAARLDVAAELACLTPGGDCTFGMMAQGYQGTQDPAFVYRITITNSGTVTLRNFSVVETTDTTFEDTSGLYFVPGAKLSPGESVTRYSTNILGMDTIYTATVTGQSSQNGTPVMASSTAMAMVRPAVTQPPLSIQAARLDGGQVQFAVQTESGITSQVEYTESLSPPRWTVLQTILGDGSVVTVSDAITNAPQRFYRVRVE